MNIFINKHVLKTIICHNTDITFALQSHFGLIRPFSRIYLDFPGGTSGKEPTCQCRKPKSYQLISGSGRSPGGGNGNPLQYSCLENPLTEEPGRLFTKRSCTVLKM